MSENIANIAKTCKSIYIDLGRKKWFMYTYGFIESNTMYYLFNKQNNNLPGEPPVVAKRAAFSSLLLISCCQRSSAVFLCSRDSSSSLMEASSAVTSWRTFRSRLLNNASSPVEVKQFHICTTAMYKLTNMSKVFI